MERWKSSLGLSVAALGAALLAPRLLPLLTGLPPTAEANPAEAVGEAEPEPERSPAPDVVETAEPRTIDVVVALDTSGSMDGLIDSTRARLWDIVNEIDAQDPNATLRVGLITYGTPAYGAENGFVKVQMPLTEDLDAVYAKAWEFSTRGGDEFVGVAIQVGVDSMDWAPADNPDNRRLLFIAGNETARLGARSPEVAAANAVSKGILVNMLFAGPHDRGVANHWEGVASAGNGRFMAIDAAQSAVAVSTPYDEQLRRLNEQMNASYIAYDKKGRDKLGQIISNDEVAWSLGSGSGASRVSTKGSNKHKVGDWDLVAGSEAGTIDFESLDVSGLPTGLAALEPRELEVELSKRAGERAVTKAAIQEIQIRRAQHIRAVADEGSGAGMDEAMAEMFEEQL